MTRFDASRRAMLKRTGAAAGAAAAASLLADTSLAAGQAPSTAADERDDYAGWPNVFSALPVAKDVFENRQR